MYTMPWVQANGLTGLFGRMVLPYKYKLYFFRLKAKWYFDSCSDIPTTVTVCKAYYILGTGKNEVCEQKGWKSSEASVFGIPVTKFT